MSIHHETFAAPIFGSTSADNYKVAGAQRSAVDLQLAVNWLIISYLISLLLSSILIDLDLPVVCLNNYFDGFYRILDR
eukprot:SAG11_NODE_259_length_11534_cov_3.402361_2_plen_78_part_00